MPLAAYLENGSNYETVRLIALSDRVYGKDENYDVLFDSALEAIREHPGTYARGVADAFWEFLTQAPLQRGRPAAGADRAGGAAADLRGRRGDASQPTGARAGRGRAVRLRLVRVRLHRLVHARRSLGGLGRHGTAGALSRDRQPGSRLGRRSPRPRGGRHRHGAPEPRHAALSSPPVLDRSRARRARLPAAARLAAHRRALDRRPGSCSSSMRHPRALRPSSRSRSIPCSSSRRSAPWPGNLAAKHESPAL